MLREDMSDSLQTREQWEKKIVDNIDYERRFTKM